MQNIWESLPHRPPFLFVDEIIECSNDKIITRKKVRSDEYFFAGHFPQKPIMPGVLLCEATFQSAGLLMSQGKTNGKIPVVARIEKTKFKKFVQPGDELLIHVEVKDRLGEVVYFKAYINVKDEMVMSTEFACTEVA